MILKLLHDFAISKDLLEDPAFVKKPVRWIICLDENGKLIGEGPIESVSNDPKKAKEYFIPKTTRPTGGGQVSDFLVDDIGAIFGLNTKPEQELNQRSAKNLQGKHNDFWTQVEKAEIETKDAAFSALLSFHRNIANTTPSFLKLDATGTPKWLLRKANGDEVKLGNDLLTFSVNEKLLIEDKDIICPYWRKLHAQEMEASETNAERGVCLITGLENVPIARTHTPMVTGLPKPAKGTGAGIVGFQEDAFRSYGFKQSFNSPVSIQASKTYLAALQYLSGEGKERHWLSVGPAWLCYWAVDSDEISDLFSGLLKQPDAQSVRDFVYSPWAGFKRTPDPLKDFIALTISAAGPRIVIKDWVQITIKQAITNFQSWFADLDIASYENSIITDDEKSPLSIDRLACTTVRRKSDGRFDREKLNPDLVTSLYHSALLKTALPIGLLIPILDRLKIDLAKYGLNTALRNVSRFALLRLILNRYLREKGKPEMEPQVFETTDAAYNCGRLLAIFDSLQRSAHGRSFKGATLAERYFGSASTTPNGAFAILWRLHQHHLKKLRQQGESGQRAAAKIKDSITQVMTLLRPEHLGEAPKFPRFFKLEQQGQFALGFYHQMAVRKAAIDEYMKKKQAGQLQPEEIDEIAELSENE